MKKVILHLGLPKTATTLLQQQVFSKLKEQIDYAGVKQPRNLEQDELYSIIWNLVCLDEVGYKKDISGVKALLDSRMQKNTKPFVLSEECFSLDSGETNWQEKFKRLGEVFDNYDVDIMITVRNPISAVFSYYVELYHSVKNKYVNFIDFARNSNRARIYEYQYLNSIIINSFNNPKIDYIPFELLKNDEFIPNVIEILGIKDAGQFVVRNINKKKKIKKGVKSHPKNINTIKSFVFKIPVIRRLLGLHFFKFILKPLFKKIAAIKVPFSQTTIKNPTIQETEELRLKYIESVDFIRSRVEVDYG